MRCCRSRQVSLGLASSTRANIPEGYQPRIISHLIYVIFMFVLRNILESKKKNTMYSELNLMVFFVQIYYLSIL
jgi:hypothetical protein